MPQNRSTHLVRGSALLAIGLAGYLTVRHELLPESFGELGHYRAAALAEIAENQPPLFQGRDMCYECHEDIVDLVRKDTHHSVNCEDCHGTAEGHETAYKHVALQMGLDEEIPEEEAVMFKNKDRSLCLLCHRRLSARPNSFPQIDPDEHVAFLRKEGVTVDCVECHSPHEPMFLLTETSAAQKHTIIQECFHCHDPVPETPIEEVEDHTPVFTCSDCHEALTEDFATRSHAAMSCGICHQFTKVSDTAGRIFKNGSVRFCLLCHEDKPFKDGEAVPLVTWPDHLDAKGIEGDERDKTCAQCHWEKIHTMSWATPAEGEDR